MFGMGSGSSCCLTGMGYPMWKVWRRMEMTNFKSEMFTLYLPLWVLVVKQLFLLKKKKEKSA